MANQATSTAFESIRPGRWSRVNHDEAAASAPRTIQALHNEHIYMFNLLDSLDEQVGLLARGEDADFNLLLDIVDYMQSFPDRFHHPVEDLIYQRMALHDSDVLGEVQVLLDEHGSLEKLITLLGDAIRDVRVLPTVSKKERVGELCADYEVRMREHISTEEDSILPRALEVLREEDWFIINQDSPAANDATLENSPADNYAALRGFIKGNAGKLANAGKRVNAGKLVKVEFPDSQSLLEFTSDLGTSLDYGRKAYNQGVREGWSAYWLACKSWIPRSAENRKQGFQNPVRHSWDAFLRGMSETEKPEVELFKPMQRALTWYGAFVGGRDRAADTRRDPLPDTQSGTQPGILREDDEVDIFLESMQFLEDVGSLLKLQ